MELDESKIGAIHLDPSSTELQRSWFSGAKEIFCLNAYPNGVTFSHHRLSERNAQVFSPSRTAPAAHSSLSRDDYEPGEDRTSSLSTTGFLPHQFDLRLRDTREYQLPVGRYFLYKENYARALEHQLSLLHKQGTLSSSVIYFGLITDAFLAVDKKGAVTATCLEILKQYPPGLLVIQTRSPKVLGKLATLRSFGDKLVVAVSLESPVDRLLSRYSPGHPPVGERLFACDRLRSEGVRVQLKASPILPYGDFYRDAWRFGEMLVRHADYVSFGCLASGSATDESHLRDIPVAQKIAQDQQYRMLRPFAFRCVYYAVQSLAMEKLKLPVPALSAPNQLSLFPPSAEVANSDG